MSSPAGTRDARQLVVLPADTNQARGLAEYAIDFLADELDRIDPSVVERLELFYRDSVGCGVSALHHATRAPTLLRNEALSYPHEPGATCFGSSRRVRPEKAVLANSAAVREWDANGTLFGYNPASGKGEGEFGHNDFYAVPIAAAQTAGLDGDAVLQGMLLIDEIRGRLAESFSLNRHAIDHVVHGAIASALAYGAMLGANAEQLESAIGLFVAHYIPFRAIRSGSQLSDSKGASAAISAEAAVLCVQRAMRGFQGPADIFRNPKSLFCLYTNPPAGSSCFDLQLAHAGSDFAIMQMHFKLGLYEHQSASALHGLIELLKQYPSLASTLDDIRSIHVTIYEPAWSIICDEAKWKPTTRQSADHSLPYILAATLRKAHRDGATDWDTLMLLPADYTDEAISDPLLASLMANITVDHGGDQFDKQYPLGIPTQIQIDHESLGSLDSGLVLHPMGHAMNTNPELTGLLSHKFQLLAGPAVVDLAGLERQSGALAEKSVEEIAAINSFCIQGVSADDA